MLSGVCCGEDGEESCCWCSKPVSAAAISWRIVSIIDGDVEITGSGLLRENDEIDVIVLKPMLAHPCLTDPVAFQNSPGIKNIFLNSVGNLLSLISAGH